MKHYKLIIMLFISIVMFCGCSSNKETSSNTITVYSAGDYINPEVLTMFEEETGIKVVYEEYDTNEVMYTKINAPNSTYDVICTSDYMIQKLISEKKLQTINFNNIENYKYISKDILSLSKQFDPNLNYTVPYCYGTVGILYNSKFVSKDEVKTWNVLWDPKYRDEILMPDSMRDILAVALKKNHFSLNTANEEELKKAEKDLIDQKELVQAYVIDQVKDKMVAEEAKLAVIYSGDALFTKEYNEALDYYVPDEGSNIWIDTWAILKTSKNKELSEKFINFITRPDIALMNYEYLTYPTPNTGALELTTSEDLKNNEIVRPTKDVLSRCEVMHNLGYDLTRKYNEIFMRVKMY